MSKKELYSDYELITAKRKIAMTDLEYAGQSTAQENGNYFLFYKSKASGCKYKVQMNLFQ